MEQKRRRGSVQPPTCEAPVSLGTAVTSSVALRLSGRGRGPGSQRARTVATAGAGHTGAGPAAQWVCSPGEMAGAPWSRGAWGLAGSGEGRGWSRAGQTGGDVKSLWAERAAAGAPSRGRGQREGAARPSSPAPRCPTAAVRARVRTCGAARPLVLRVLFLLRCLFLGGHAEPLGGGRAPCGRGSPGPLSVLRDGQARRLGPECRGLCVSRRVEGVGGLRGRPGKNRRSFFCRWAEG